VLLLWLVMNKEASSIAPALIPLNLDEHGFRNTELEHGEDVAVVVDILLMSACLLIFRAGVKRPVIALCPDGAEDIGHGRGHTP